MTHWLSGHFSAEEMTASQTAGRLAIDNTPPADILENLRKTCDGLELVRTLLGEPLIISSGYRSEKLNEAVGGVGTSAHCHGWAADFICPAFGSPYEICGRIMASDIKFDQCIQEGHWVHISFDPKMRRQALTAKFDSNGKATYSDGVKA